MKERWRLWSAESSGPGTGGGDIGHRSGGAKIGLDRGRTAQNVALPKLLGAVAVAEEALQLPLVLLPPQRQLPGQQARCCPQGARCDDFGS